MNANINYVNTEQLLHHCSYLSYHYFVCIFWFLIPFWIGTMYLAPRVWGLPWKILASIFGDIAGKCQDQMIQQAPMALQYTAHTTIQQKRQQRTYCAASIAVIILEFIGCQKKKKRCITERVLRLNKKKLTWLK